MSWPLPVGLRMRRCVARGPSSRDPGREVDDLLRALLSNTVSRTMEGYWQRHLEGVAGEPGLLDWIGAENDHDSDVIALAEEIEADDGRMSREDVAKAFGQEAADKAFGLEENQSKRQWKGREPFAPKRPSVRPEPWSELKKPTGLPSFTP